LLCNCSRLAPKFVDQVNQCDAVPIGNLFQGQIRIRRPGSSFHRASSNSEIKRTWWSHFEVGEGLKNRKQFERAQAHAPGLRSSYLSRASSAQRVPRQLSATPVSRQLTGPRSRTIAAALGRPAQAACSCKCGAHRMQRRYKIRDRRTNPYPQSVHTGWPCRPVAHPESRTAGSDLRSGFRAEAGARPACSITSRVGR